jgi:hypothetical protein
VHPRKNALLKAGSKSDRIDARKLAELLRGNHLKSVYHGETGVRMLRELARSYLTIVEDQIRVMSRLKALYRSWGVRVRDATSTTSAIGRSGWRSSGNRVFATAPNGSISNWMRCNACAGWLGTIY